MLRPAYPLDTDRLLLRPYRDDDLEALHEIERLDETARYLYNAPLDTDATRALLERRKALTAIDEEHDRLVLAATLKETGTVIGHVTLEVKSREHRQGEIGYVLHPDHQGHGYAIEAAAMMLRLGFEARHASDRRPARRPQYRVGACPARLGMRLEGNLRENEFVKGEWVSELIYAILASEWRRSPPRQELAPGARIGQADI